MQFQIDWQLSHAGIYGLKETKQSLRRKPRLLGLLYIKLSDRPLHSLLYKKFRISDRGRLHFMRIAPVLFLMEQRQWGVKTVE